MDEGIILNDTLQRTSFKWMERVILMSHDLVLHPTILMNVDVNRVPGIYILVTTYPLRWLGPENLLLVDDPCQLPTFCMMRVRASVRVAKVQITSKWLLMKRDAFYPRWWFQTFFGIFTPKIGEMIHFDEHIFQMA